MNADPRGIGIGNCDDQLEVTAVTRWQTMLACAGNYQRFVPVVRAKRCVPFSRGASTGAFA